MAADRYKVFISWSGQLAREVAGIWSELLTETFDAVVPFMSERDIGAGERNLPKIADELEGSRFGIVVVTQLNNAAPWINFEAGALSKVIGEGQTRVAPCLVDFSRENDLTGPLSQFQATLLNRAGVEKILIEIAKLVDADVVAVSTRFERSWSGTYESRFNEAKSKSAGDEAQRSEPDMLNEILTHVRELARTTPAHQNPAEIYRLGQIGGAKDAFDKYFESLRVNEFPSLIWNSYIEKDRLIVDADIDPDPATRIALQRQFYIVSGQLKATSGIQVELKLRASTEE